MKTAIVNIGQIVTGDWKSPLAGGNAGDFSAAGPSGARPVDSGERCLSGNESD
jgi:hypothetical protein